MSKLLAELKYNLQFIISLMYNDYTTYNYIITSHILNTGGNHIIESDK